ncbi:DUF1295-domain-containing protein [Tilletiopsis washingtonensis]|uniref:DUF1295-domain-containing protein n=1 Tax=Tilletiopsis washingtonensis TaxID=58919 RepID=A0A316Z4C2_9BASI|nr:DUF1295-domain-containing protein [Tilletiopsis washingtonensis]PWN96590.1 DUF1295-domain-containing protein [Tilletiopsis washingtonensis]
MFHAVLDPYYLAITALVTIGWQAAGFAIAFGLQIDTITDFWSATNFGFLALLTLNLGAAYEARNIVATIFVLLWAVRLGGWQLFRLLQMGSDTRFDEMRSKPLSFAQFWAAQALWVWTVSLPLTILNSPAVSRVEGNWGGAHVSFGTARDIVGVILWAIGFGVEALADIQKYTFKQSKPPQGAITDKGLWGLCRRPNYFGEIVHWLGIYLLCISPASSPDISRRGHDALLGSVVSPLFTFCLLMFLSGVPLAEKPTQQKYYLMAHAPRDGDGSLEPFGKRQREEDPWRRMQAFRNRTSLLIPLPPALYKPLPTWLKRTVLLDFPFYNFDEHKDGPKALEEEQKKQAQDD